MEHESIVRKIQKLFSLAKYQRQWDAKQRARIKNLDHGAYWDGHAKGSDIGLDGQVASGNVKVRIS
jgi:hypothetical protein